MSFSWQETINTTTLVKLDHIIEIQENVDSIDDNLACSSYNSGVLSSHDSTERIGHNNAYDGNHDASERATHYGTYDGNHDSTERVNHNNSVLSTHDSTERVNHNGTYYSNDDGEYYSGFDIRYNGYVVTYYDSGIASNYYVLYRGDEGGCDTFHSTKDF